MIFTDDPVRDYDRYDAYMAQLEAKLPHCDRCGCPIRETYFLINGEILCEDCMHDEYARSSEDYLSDNY